MAEAAGSPPPGGDVTRAPTIIGVYCALTSVSITCVAARLYTRFHLLRSPGKDDAVIVLSMVIVFISFVLECYDTKWGSGRHTYYLSKEETLLASKWNYVAAPWGIMGLAIPKLAIVLFLQRIVGKAKRLRMLFLYFITYASLVFSGIDVVILFLQCNPPHSAWNRSVPHTCWSPNVLSDISFFIGGWTALNDLVLALFPATIIYELQMSVRNKIALSVVLGLGIFSAVCAIVRTTKLAAYQSSLDYTWTSAESILWSGAEMNVIMICACVPTFLPLIQQITGRKDYRSKKLPDPTIYNDCSRRPMRKSGSLRLLNSHTTGEGTKVEGSQVHLSDNDMRTPTTVALKREEV